MPKPPGTVEVKTRKKFCNSIIPRSSASSKYLNESRSLVLNLWRGRSQPPEVSQLDLLVSLDKSLEPALRIETVPVNLTVGVEQRFWLIHQESALRLPGQFSQAETECILKTTAEWDWAIEYRPRTPNCSYHLLCLLNRVCTPQLVLEVAV